MVYIDRRQKKYPYVIHRDIGCYERTLGCALSNSRRRTAVMACPGSVASIADKHHDYAQQIGRKLQDAGIRAEVDCRNEKIGYKIREAQLEKVPYMLITGDKEEESGQVAVRSRRDGDLGPMPLNDFIARIAEEVRARAK